MDSDALHTFVTIHRAGGFSPAAERLGRSQPAISRRIALLEGELGMPLFERVSGGVALSQAGRVLLPYAERVLAALKDTSDALSALRSGDGGPIAIATVGTLASTSLTAVLKRFARQFPKVEISLRTAVSTEVSELVRSGEATVGLRYFDDPSPDLIGVALRPERLVIACAPKHPLAGKRVRSLRELRDEKWVAFLDAQIRRDPSAGNVFAQFLTRDVANIQWMPVDSLTAQKRLIEAGFGISLLPESSIAEERKTKALAVISVGDLKAANPVTAIMRRDGYLSSASRKLLDILKRDYR
ncbi:MAG: LysR family transcriptional regulator [Parvibaculum sp.]|uniref:LysR family transcriptional regulator n=1 Tax=Parvibaculum sp. TaxID=2024848 RepID=UPI0025F53001|nr:LysR family transcriptional regulator [Parvibaculum sp.]MCE9648739.1 LysR family transcriptional regulator [Parvibaculum sp.]